MRFGMLYCAMADAREGFPETYCVVVTSCAKDYTHGPILRGEAETFNYDPSNWVDPRSFEALESTLLKP